MYGDAADVFVDNDGNGRMDDLNRDGRIDSRDAQVILDAVERVERAHPDLVGGVGVYRATRAHGPFAHVDVRGTRARWGRPVSAARTPSRSRLGTRRRGAASSASRRSEPFSSAGRTARSPRPPLVEPRAARCRRRERCRRRRRRRATRSGAAAR